MNREDQIHLLASELKVCLNDWKYWGNKDVNAGDDEQIEWSKIDHLDFGQARGRYTMLLRVLRIMGIEVEVNEYMNSREYDSFTKA